ncbi:hypothetical protein [Novosphingobium sp. 9]|uniref:hypothetical protein n=1 Tax=Novosphingobium sp. 9 TaxID=2025349 RepID=UPI0021B681E3|nr:hypothetical protein [Novosphingobium sp. 9]
MATAIDRLNACMADTSDVYIGAGWDAASYLRDIERGLRAALCEPFPIRAVAIEPGFPETAVGETLDAICVAHEGGYWLGYQPALDRFVCFWGEHPDRLDAAGIFGSPLGCWSA